MVKNKYAIGIVLFPFLIAATAYAGSTMSEGIHRGPYPDYNLNALHLSLLADKSAKSDESKNEDKVFQKLQAELDKEKNRRKVLERFEMAGQRGLTLGDISLTLLNYSYHETDDSGRPQAFITAKCHIDISLYEKQAAELRKREPRAMILLPDSERIVLGVFDDAKDELITLVDFPTSMKPITRFMKLRKNKPEYMILTAEQDEDSDGLMWQAAGPVIELGTAIIGYDTTNKTYFIIKEIKTYEHVAADGPDGSIAYVDKAAVSWSDWINNEYRELIVTTKRKILSISGNAKAEFKNRKEVYRWISDKEISLVERIDDGKRTINRRRF